MHGAPTDPERRGREDEHATELPAPAGTSRGPALATAPELAVLSARMLDPGFMLEVFRRELPASSDEPVRVLACAVKPAKTVSSRKALRAGRSACVYRLEIEIGLGSGETREIVLHGLGPVGPDFPGQVLARRCRELGAHPAAAPFARLALRLRALPVGILFFPLDPALPALAEVASPAAAGLLAPYLPECRAGARIERCAHELRHYKPGERAVLRLQVEFGGGPPAARNVYVKLFGDEHGAASHRELADLWRASRGSRWLRVPEPLGYDPARRMLVLAEVPGGRALADWIHCLEHDQPLPAGVDVARLESCVLAAARALAELQACGVRTAKRRAYQDVLASLAKDRELLAGRAQVAPPGLVRRALALVERLESAAPPDEPLAPSHGGARHKQTVGDEHGLTFIDWDGFCLANPALDAATFLARLRLEPVTNPGHGVALERLAESFRSEFLARSCATPLDLELYEALVLSEQMLRSFRRTGRGADSIALAERLLDAADERLTRVASAR